MTWVLIAAMAAITFFNRFAFFAESLRYQPGLKVRKFLGYSSYAILTSIWTPILFRVDANDGLRTFSTAGADYLIAASIAAILTIFGVRSIIVVLISTAAFFILRFLVF